MDIYFQYQQHYCVNTSAITHSYKQSAWTLDTMSSINSSSNNKSVKKKLLSQVRITQPLTMYNQSLSQKATDLSASILHERLTSVMERVRSSNGLVFLKKYARKIFSSWQSWLAESKKKLNWQPSWQRLLSETMFYISEFYWQGCNPVQDSWHKKIW